MTICSMCRGIGWILDANDIGKPRPRMVEFIECPLPDCPVAGQPVQNVAFKGTPFDRASAGPDGRIMSVSVS